MPAFLPSIWPARTLPYQSYKFSISRCRQSLEIKMKNTFINMRSISVLFFLTSIFLSLQVMANNNNSDETSKSDVNIPSTAELLNTYWKLIEISGDPVVTKQGQREKKLTLHVEENKVNGFGGCNSFFGTYTVDTGSLKFGPLAATRRFCADSMDQENQFFKLLSVVTSYTINGQELDLIDDQGKPVLKLEAVYLKLN